MAAQRRLNRDNGGYAMSHRPATWAGAALFLLCAAASAATISWEPYHPVSATEPCGALLILTAWGRRISRARA